MSKKLYYNLAAVKVILSRWVEENSFEFFGKTAEENYQQFKDEIEENCQDEDQKDEILDILSYIEEQKLKSTFFKPTTLTMEKKRV